MSSVLRPVRKRKKVARWARSDREEYAELDVDTKVELIRSLVPLGLMHVEELHAEVTALAGARYARHRSEGAVMAATPGRSVWPANACRFACHGFAMSRGARCRYGPTRRCMGSAR